MNQANKRDTSRARSASLGSEVHEESKIELVLNSEELLAPPGKALPHRGDVARVGAVSDEAPTPGIAAAS
jgi:hypothetical protein